jgi:hypothetical protein
MRLAVTLFSLVAAGPAFADEFRFKVPHGWIGAFAHEPPDDLGELRAKAAEQARLNGFHLFAVNPEDMVDAPPPTMAVVLKDQSHSFDQASLDRWADDAPKSFSDGANVRVRERALVSLNGGTSARLVIEYTVSGREVTQLLFRIPGRTQVAILAFDVVRAKFARYRPIFEESALATTGFSPPSADRRRLGWALVLMAAIAVAALMAAIAVAALLARRRAKRDHSRAS